MSESLRNLVMGHAPNSDTFQRHYLNRNICADRWAIQRNIAPQQQLTQQATSHGHSRSSRRPINLTQEQAKELRKDSKMVNMTEGLEKLPLRSPARRDLRPQVNARYTKLYKEATERIRHEWTEKQAIHDIEWQIQGNSVEELVQPGPDVGALHPVQTRMLAALQASMETDLDQQLKRRAQVIHAIAEYCQVQESGGPSPLGPKSPLAALPPQAQPQPQPQPQQAGPSTLDAWKEELRRSVVLAKPGSGEKVLRCFVCVARAFTVPPNDPWRERLCHQYYSSNEASRHFKRIHVTTYRSDKRNKCPICPDLLFQYKDHFRNHAEIVHGISL